jgi:hypothetical protein
MRKIALLGASALVLALGVASASAQPSGQEFLTRSQTGVTVTEGRAAAVESSTPAADAFIWQQHNGR